VSKFDKLRVDRADRKAEGVLVFRLSGVLDSSTESYAFLEEVQRESHAAPPRIVLDIRGVNLITSAGVGIIAACYTSVSNAGGRICLSSIQGRALQILNVVRLLDVVDNAPSEDAAVKILAP
jgi:anti-anti-sigma factor